jgi:hypothetical protein
MRSLQVAATLITRRLLPFAPLLAALVFGGWAMYVNRQAGLTIALRSGLAQGVYAVFCTQIVGRVAVDVFRRTLGMRWRYILSFGASFLAMIAIPAVLHRAVGTPEILAAVLPGLIWGSGYIVAILGALSRDIGFQ